MSKQKSRQAWHFLAAEGTLRDGTKVRKGQRLVFDGPLSLCNSGYHASTRLIDALNYAPGPWLCRVEVGGEIITGHDKLVASERTILWQGDISTLLHEFACDEAERALKAQRKAGDAPDPRSWAAIEAKRKWLRGEITDAELDAASATAWAAAWAAARDAASATVRATARAAAWAAASAAERAAAWAAAWGTAWDAADRRLTRRVNAYMRANP